MKVLEIQESPRQEVDDQQSGQPPLLLLPKLPLLPGLQPDQLLDAALQEVLLVLPLKLHQLEPVHFGFLIADLAGPDVAGASLLLKAQAAGLGHKALG